MKHDPNGPSRLAQREMCPGSLRLETASMRDPSGLELPGTSEDESDHSRRGRFLHDVIANCIAELTPPTEAMLVVEDEFRGEDYTDALDAVLLCWGWAMGRIGNHPIDGGDPLILIEYRVDLADYGIGAGGTVDLAIVWPGRCFDLTDWKFGVTPTADPLVNRQMHAYALGIAQGYGCSSGEVSIVQPDGMGVEPIRTAHYTPEMIARLAGEIRYIVDETKREDAPLVPGEHCRWCKVINGCPARQSQAEAIIARRALPITNTIAAMQPADRLPYVERMRLARAWLDGALRDIDNAIIDSRLLVPGFVVAEGRKSREWVSEDAALAVMREAGVQEDLLRESKVISPAKAEKLLGKARSGKLRGAIVSTPGKPRVVREGTTGAVDE